MLHEPSGFDRMHIGIVLEDRRLKRRGSSADASIEELLTAFSHHDQPEIERLFQRDLRSRQTEGWRLSGGLTFIGDRAQNARIEVKDPSESISQYS